MEGGFRTAGHNIQTANYYIWTGSVLIFMIKCLQAAVDKGQENF